LVGGAASGVLWTWAQVADAVALPTGVTARALEDLAAHGVVERHADRNLHRWGPSEWLRRRWDDLALPVRSERHLCLDEDPDDALRTG
jgi:DNA-binding IclR family transcriptional regulator